MADVDANEGYLSFSEYKTWLNQQLNNIGLQHRYFMGKHIIYKEKRKRFLGLFPYTKNKTVAIIKSEPRILEKVSPTFSYNGLEIKVLNDNYLFLLTRVAREFENKYGEIVNVEF